MCTALSETGRYHLFGRTLDLEMSYVESVAITPRNFVLDFRHEGKTDNHPAIIGIAHMEDGTPLYYDAMNENGLAIAGLNFPGNAVYRDVQDGFFNVASFEFIPWVLSKCASVSEARELIETTNITNASFSEKMPATPLHFIISDKKESITVEPLSDGVRIYDNPFGVLANNPPFCYHTANVANYMHLTSAPPKNELCAGVKLERYSRGMGAIGLPGDYSSPSRFVRAVFAKNNTSYENDEAGEVNRFFHIMDTVSVPRGCVKTDEGKDVLTVYTSCGNTDTGRYYYTTYADRTIRSFGMQEVWLDGKLVISRPI